MNPDVAVRSRTGHDKVESVETPDEYTVVMTLKEPFAPFQLLWTGGVTSIIPAHILGDGQDINTAPFNTSAPVGTGPFQFVEHVGGDHLTVERNLITMAAPPKLDRIIVKLIPEVPLMFTQLKTGGPGHRLSECSAERWEEAQNTEGNHGCSQADELRRVHLFQQLLPQFQDKRVKQALYHAMDAQTIIDTIYFGFEPDAHLPQPGPLGVQPGREDVSVRSGAGQRPPRRSGLG